jgi:hypothetical protein
VPEAMEDLIDATDVRKALVDMKAKVKKRLGL